MSVLKNIKISTTYNEVHDITKEVKQVVEESGIKEGICIVHNMLYSRSCCFFSLGSRWIQRFGRRDQKAGSYTN